MTRAALLAKYKKLVASRDNPRAYLRAGQRRQLTSEIRDTLSQIKAMDTKTKGAR